LSFRLPSARLRRPVTVKFEACFRPDGIRSRSLAQILGRAMGQGLFIVSKGLRQQGFETALFVLFLFGHP
jgi:hypothetical protein